MSADAHGLGRSIWKFVGLGVLVGIPIYTALTSRSPDEPPSSSIVGAVFRVLASQPFALVFLVVAAGYLIGRIQIRGLGLGATGATLVLALETSVWALAGEGLRFEISAFASTIFFNLFMFAVGMKVGPQFLGGLKGNGIKFVTVAVMIPGLSFLFMLGLRGLFDFGPGFSPGILAGGNTATPGLGAAQTAYSSGVADTSASLQEVMGNLSTSFAFAYSITIVPFVLLLKIISKAFRRDPEAEAKDYVERTMGSGPLLPGQPWASKLGVLPVSTRCYTVGQGCMTNRTLAELRTTYPMVAVERVMRASVQLQTNDDLRLEEGDVVALFATTERLVAIAPQVGTEVDLPDLRETERHTVDLVLTKPYACNKKLGDLAKDIGHGIYLNAVFRGGESIPFGPELVTHRSDVLRITANPERIARLEREVGEVVRPSLNADMVTLGLGLAAGALLGAITVPMGPVMFTLGPAVGLLIIGIALGAIRTRQPHLGGPFPEPARRILEDLGLSVFVAILGLTSGAGVLDALSSGGVVPILGSALVVGLFPALSAFTIGVYLLKMNTALLLGAVAGGSASAAGLNASQEATHSTVPALAYPVAFAVGNILITLLSYVLATMD